MGDGANIARAREELMAVMASKGPPHALLPPPRALLLDEAHRYWLGDRQLIGCTETLREVGLLDARYYNEEGMARGSRVHRYIQTLLEGNWDPKWKGELYAFQGYVEAAQAYLRDSDAEILNVEISLCDPDRGMAGTPDLIALIKPKMLQGEQRFAVIDWKTGQPEAWHAYQTAWYEHLARVNKLVEGLCDRIVVHLRQDGTYTIRTFKDRNDWKVADAARVVEQARRAA